MQDVYLGGGTIFASEAASCRASTACRRITARMLPNVAYRNSPIRLIPDAASPFLVCVGKNETAGFLRQHDAFVKAWASDARPLVDASIAGENHFSIIEHLGRRESSLFKTFIPYVLGKR